MFRKRSGINTSARPLGTLTFRFRKRKWFRTESSARCSLALEILSREVKGGMKIDLQVEREMLTNPDFQAVLSRACWELSRPKKVKQLCFHEVGHLIYFEPI